MPNGVSFTGRRSPRSITVFVVSSHEIRRRPEGVDVHQVHDWNEVVMAGEAFRNAGDVEVAFARDARPVASTALPYLRAITAGVDGVVVQVDEWVFLMTRASQEPRFPDQASGDREPLNPLPPHLSGSIAQPLPEE